MIVDIIFALIIIGSMVFGYRNGFVRTFLHLTGWILATVLGFVWFPHVKQFLLDKTDFYDSLYEKLLENFSDSMPAAEDTFAHLPSIIGDGYNFFTTNIAAAAAESFAGFLFTIISFLLVIIGVKIILSLITGALSKANNDGLPGFIDGLLGCFLGLVKGVLLSFVLLAFAVPIIGLSSPEHASNLMDSIYVSHLTLELYDNNLLLLIVRDFLG